MARGAQEIDGQLTAAIDIYSAAKLDIDQYGDQAALRAAVRADALLDAGDLDGTATWRKIIAAIETMRSTEPDGRLH